MYSSPSAIVRVGVAGALQTLGDIVISVDQASGSDSVTTTRPEYLVTGDYGSEPYATVRAAVSAVPKYIYHNVSISVGAGNYEGFEVEGFNVSSAGSFLIIGSHVTVTPTSGSATGTATSGTSNTLTASGAGWTSDDFVGNFCRIVSGTGAGQNFIIASNTTDTLTFSGHMGVAPDNTSDFEIVESSATITSDGYEAGIFVTSCSGVTSINNLSINGPTYGVKQINSNGMLELSKITSIDGYHNFYAQNSINCSWSQIGSIGSTSHGIVFDNVNSIGEYTSTKGWLATDAGNDGVYVLNCHGGGCQGVYVDNSASNGINVTGSVLQLSYISLNNNSGSGVYNNFGTRLDLSGLIEGTGNSDWGIDLSAGSGMIVTISGIPTITGTSGDATVDGSFVTTWSSDFGSINEYVHFIPRDIKIVRVS